MKAVDLSFLTKPKRFQTFKEFLTARGCQVLPATNEWEVLRFTAGVRTNVVYRNKRGELRPSGEDINPAVVAFSTGGSWRAQPVTNRRGGSRKHRQIVAALSARDGTDCFFCGLALGDDVTIEEFVSVTHGGARTVANCALAHRACNHAAGHLSVVEKVKLRDRMRQPSERAAAFELVGAVNDLRAARGLPPLPTPIARAAA